MSGIVFFRTENRAETVSFYTDRLGFDVWLEQDGGCTILAYDNLLVGFCDGTETETDGIVTVVLDDEAAVDDCHADLADVARGPPKPNDDFGIYQFFATDPDGRTVEVQTFQHETPPVGSSSFSE
ncbi:MULTISPECIES: VOC family protein [Halomicrobium]|uniref:Glyoxalase/bleomycin resistance protein/dioxygenase n=2 Tax=Halomicrobium mukohataei TaxID=57705 RepID=C7NX66_HALMD|nr:MULTISPECIES: VOC family protein [Halomicrobium]ACV46431.1 glyoxalase/bleomycin resistance protein/dioxygenase [Halomicrobium mukohataei DSM 12286]QCD64981.1 VOC family protein [Halomicrobium mukohataei]QFR19787.1 VOC family protein [Halomicrobium sp. ZPS1]